MITTITFITTTNYNVGDDFVRLGIHYLLGKEFGPSKALLIHKHIPLTVRPELEWFYTKGVSNFLDSLPRGRSYFWSRIIDSLPLNKKTDKIYNCDFLVQSGAPVYWKNAHTNEWFAPLIKRRYLKVKDKVPFINVGAGSCLPYTSDGSEIIDECACVDYIKELYSLCRVTTARDTLSKNILSRLGLDVPVIPCPSLFARDYYETKQCQPEYIALNFMPHGGHFHLGQKIDSQLWETTFKKLYKALSGEFPVVLFCHDRKEYMAAKKILPEAKRFFSFSAKDYLNAYSRAKFFIGNRVHGAFAMASFGRPAFVVGSDSRALMMKEIGLKSIYVNDAHIDILMDASRELEMQHMAYREEFEAIKSKALRDYSDALEPIIRRL
jgi:hypothetical protein